MDISVFGPIFTQKNIPKYLCDQDIHTMKYGSKKCGNSSCYWRQSYFSTILCSPRRKIRLIRNRRQRSLNNNHRDKYIKGSLRMGYTNYIIRDKKWWQFFISMDLEPYFYYLVSTNTLNQSNEKLISAQLDQYLPRNIYQNIYDAITSIL